MSSSRVVTMLCAGLMLGASALSCSAALIRVGINASYAPFETVDDTGHLSGFDIDLVNAWAKTQHLQVKFVNLTWPRLLDSLTQGRVDMVVSAIAVTPERQQSFSFSRPYYYEPQVLLRPAASREDDPRALSAIGVLTGSSALGWLSRLGVRPAAMQLYDGLPPMIVDLRHGTIQAAFGDAHAMFQASNGDASLRVVRKPAFGQDAYAFVLRKDEPALLAQTNHGLAALQSAGTINKLRLSYPGL